jgi:histidyl-tRNA synthetase
VALVPIGEEAEAFMLRLAEDLRDQGLVIDLGYSGNLQRRMRRADRIGVRAAVLLGDDELARGAVTVRDFDTGEQTEVPLGSLAARLLQLG